MKKSTVFIRFYIQQKKYGHKKILYWESKYILPIIYKTAIIIKKNIKHYFAQKRHIN